MTGSDDFAAMSSGDDSVDVPADPINPDPHQPDPYDSAGFTSNDDPVDLGEDPDDASGMFAGEDDEPWVASFPAAHESIEADSGSADPDVDLDIDDPDIDDPDIDDVDIEDVDIDDSEIGDLEIAADDDLDSDEVVEEMPDDASEGSGEADDVDALMDALSAGRDDAGVHHTTFIPPASSLAIGPDPAETAWAVPEVNASPGFVDPSLLQSPN